MPPISELYFTFVVLE